MTKRIQHITTILLLLLIVCSGKAWADTWDGTTPSALSGTTITGNGTEADPYLIQSAADLAYFGSKYPSNSQWWKLTTDVDLDNKTWSYGQKKSAFAGHFDGDGHTISNINIPVTSTGNYGFFSIVEGTSASERAEVKNLTLSNVSISSEIDLSGTYIGGLAGRLMLATVTNVHILGGIIKVSGNKTGDVYIGNMGGSTMSLTGTTVNVDFIKCFTENVTLELNGNVTTGNVYASNFLGQAYHNTKISNCHVVNSTITTTSGGTIAQDKSFCMGGLIGAVNNLAALNQTGDITNCSVTGQTIYLTSYGPANASNFYLNNFAIGGAIGRVMKPFKLPQDIYFSGTINAPKATVGPVVGVIMNTRTSDAFVYNDYSGENISTSYMSKTDRDAAFSTWSYGNYQLGISSDLLSSGKQLNITSADVVNGYVTIGDISGWKNNKIGTSDKASKTIIWYTANNSSTSSSTAQGIYPKWSQNDNSYPSYYMYYLQGVNRGSYSPANFTYTLQLHDWPSTASIQVEGDANASASYNTNGGTVTTNPNRITATNVTASAYNGFTSHACVDNSAMTITACYTKQYNLQLVGAPSSGVSVTIDHDYNNGTFTSGTYTAGGTVEVTPSFTVADVHVAAVDGYTFTTAVDDANSTITVTYALTTYSVTVNDPSNGSIKLWDSGMKSSLKKTAGTTIYMLATPADGYVLSAWNVTDAEGNAVAVSNNTFTMPAKNVTVTATFEAAPSLVAGNYVVIQSASATGKYLKVPEATTGAVVTAVDGQYDPESVMKLVRYEDYDGNKGGFWLNGVTNTGSWVGYPQNNSNNLSVVSTSTHDVKDASGNKTNNGYGWAGNYSISKCGTDANGAIYQLTDINYNCLNRNSNFDNRTIALKSDNTHLAGSTGSTDASKWYIHVVTPYTVSIKGATGTVTYNGTNLYGAAQTQSDGGTYYFEGEPVKAQFIGNTTVANKAGKVTIDNENHTITVDFIDAYSYTMTLVDLPSGSSVKVAGDIDNATYTESGTVITNNGSLTESDITLTPATNASGFSKRVVIDNTARTIKAGYAQAYTLTFVDAPAGATAIIAHDFDGGSHNANGTIYLTQTITEADITASAAGYNITKAIDNTEHTITLTYDNGSKGISSFSEITDMSGNYFAKSDFTFNGTSLGTQADPFTGTFDGRFVTISGTTSALFGYVDGGTIKNVTLDNVNISGGTNVGAIANEASGNARIYNCQVLASGSRDFIANPANEDKSFDSSSTVSGSGAVGGIVGLISGNVRVINCVSYADVSGGTYGAGIVGRYDGSWITNTGTTVNGTGIMVMNCLMLGNVKSGSTQMSPVVGGSGVTGTISTWDYFRYASMTNAQNMTTAQNGAIAIDEDRWLDRWQFHRAALNNHRNLAAVYCFNDASRMNEIAKWTVDESISRWPILKAHDSNTRKTLDRTIPNTTADYAGRQLGTLPVTVKIVGAGNTEYSYNANLPITDMDTLRYDYTCGKVILPFANEFTGWTPQTTTNTNYDRIIIGWEITSLTGGTKGTFSDYNFADRNCTAKDVYDATNNPFIYAQGGMFIVPNGVTAITITAHWANAFYLADEYYDVDISARTGSTQTGNLVYNAGKRTATTYNGKTIYTTLLSAQDKMSTDYLVHSQAVVLVGNYHSNDGNALRVGKGCTIMSIDEDCDQEPDYGFYNTEVGKTIYYKQFPATRWDFIPVFATGYFQMCNTRAMEFSCAKTVGWWEFTETSLMRSFELQAQDAFHQNNDNGKGNNAYILNGGCHQQFIRGRGGNMAKLSYVRVGGTAYVKEFFQGNHSNDTLTWTIRPIIVTGGEIEKCYMTGQKTGKYVKTNDTKQPNNVRFYCSGGKIDKYLSCYMEYPIKDVNVHIDHALINKFYGGGTTQVGRVLGNINVDIKNSYVAQFCGGPEFGDMESGMKVTVNAENTTFGNYYGAGYGGTALTRVKSTRNGGEKGNAQSASKDIDNYNSFYLKYDGTYKGIGTSYEVEEFMNAYGWYYFRFYNYVANLDLASTGDVTSTLTGCKILNDFYGGGCQGKVNGTINSTLTNCNVVGSVFGGGYKAAATEVGVYERLTEWPLFDTVYGIFDPVKYPTPTKYKWEHVETMPTGNPYGTNAKGENVLYTTTNTSEMGVVTGAIDLTITNGKVGGSVFGGGNESLSKNNTSVKILGTAEVGGNVYGGGNAAEVQGTTKVQIGEDCNTPQE